jgi:hypothetical protein
VKAWVWQANDQAEDGEKTLNSMGKDVQEEWGLYAAEAFDDTV